MALYRCTHDSCSRCRSRSRSPLTPPPLRHTDLGSDIFLRELREGRDSLGQIVALVFDGQFRFKRCAPVFIEAIDLLTDPRPTLRARLQRAGKPLRVGAAR
jgi:hypothetical protein